jgi:hypothetical protein
VVCYWCAKKPIETKLKYMLEIILKLFEYAPQIATYGLVVILVAAIVWKAAVFYINTKRATDKFPKIETTLGKIDKGLATLNQILLEKTVITQSCYSNENSPRVVNELGQRLLKDSGAEKLFNEIESELIAGLEKTKFDSLLELERSSLNVLLDKMNDPRFKDVQNFAFEHPTFDGKPLTYTDMLFLMSLKLRDAYREKYPESKLGDDIVNSVNK